MAFKPPPATKPGLWRRTPPAVFPSIMGLFGLGLAWRRAADAVSGPEGIGEVILGAASLLFLFALVAYLSKLARRPGVLIEELRIVPGRAGVGTMVLCLYLLALALAPYAASVAYVIAMAGFAAHGVLVLVLIYVFATGPAEQRRVTPVWHLNFVGFIIGALALTQLGSPFGALAVFGVTTLIAVWIWAVGLEQVLRETVPPPLRPIQAIHLSPAALLGLVAAALGLEAVATCFAALSAVILVWLLVRVLWLTAGGFSALWGAFTFPAAATASLWLTLGGIWHWPGIAALALATFIIPPIAFWIIRLWAGGQLAVKTNAATA